VSDLDPQVRKQQIISVFDEVAGGYDSPALRFFPFSADRVLSYLSPRPGSVTGTPSQ